ncbi:MAG: DNA-directed RNA polymerase subunit E'' [Candidatus Altiarchaeota archaeon]|nr:DNA-directed RNA polymerase subunit E'' [Candidatus Altiarchaeota archaeon]
MRACKKCLRITEGETCSICKVATSQYWSGFLCVIDPEKSEIAKKLGIKTPGQYAMKVR